MYSTTASYRGANLPSYGASSSRETPLFGTRKGEKPHWERLGFFAFVGLSLVLFVVSLYQGNRISLLNLDKEQMQRDVASLNRESASLRASLSNAHQEHEHLERDLDEALSKIERVEISLKRAQSLREGLQADSREAMARLKECEATAKKREEELEADIAAVTQERNDLKIRVDTEHAMSATWAQSLADSQAAVRKCEERFKALDASTVVDEQSRVVHEEETTTEGTGDLDLGRKAAAGEDESGTRETVETLETADTVGSQKDLTRNRKDLER